MQSRYSCYGGYWYLLGSLFLVLEDRVLTCISTAKHVKNVKERKQMLAMLIGYSYTVADYYLQFQPDNLLVNKSIYASSKKFN